MDFSPISRRKPPSRSTCPASNPRASVVPPWPVTRDPLVLLAWRRWREIHGGAAIALKDLKAGDRRGDLWLSWFIGVYRIL